MYFLHGSASALTLSCLLSSLLPKNPDKNPVCSEVSLLYHSPSSPPLCGETSLVGLLLGIAGSTDGSSS